MRSRPGLDVPRGVALVLRPCALVVLQHRVRSDGIPDHALAITHVQSRPPWHHVPVLSQALALSHRPLFRPPGTPSSSSRTKPCTRPSPRPTTPQPKPPPPPPTPLPRAVPPQLLPPTLPCPQPAQPCPRMGPQVPSLRHTAFSAAVATVAVAVAAAAATAAQASLHAGGQARTKTRMTTAQGSNGRGILVSPVLPAMPSPVHMT